MNDNRTFRLFALILVIALLCLVAYTGIGPVNSRIIKGANDVRTGTDIRGGISAVMQPVYPNGTQGRNVSEDLASARSIIEKRLDAQRGFDKTITIDSTNNRLVIDIPWAQNEKEYNPRKALAELGGTGELTFQEVKPEEAGLEESQLTPSGKIVLTGQDVETASSYQDQDGTYRVLLKFKASGVDKFSEATGRLVNQKIAIFMDQICLSAPNVEQRITSNEATIYGHFTYESAKALADRIRFGALPCKLEPVSVDSISAQLGQGALNIALTAGLVSFILVCLFMILYYRLPGLLSCLAVSLLVALTVLVLANFNISLTLSLIHI
ncbi:MAG: protein translocase subunit SecD, partial [Clostridia bacterium]|nr:protein translocase subunit SecD [Clostridia bacterium]